MKRLDGKVALVTGAGRGIGRAVALRFAAEGAAVALTARTTDQLVDTASLIDTPTIVVPADVAADDSAERLVEATLDGLGSLDILVNAARTAFKLAQVGGQWMLSNTGGSIVNVASIGGLVGLPRLAAYCASKGALIQLTRALALDWANRGVRVNAIAPAYVRTELSRPLCEHPDFSAKLLTTTPLGRFAETDEIAAAIAFLASPDAAYLTGAVLPADGGWTAA